MTTPDRPAFSLTQIPFSRRGSWLNISPVVGLHETAPDLHLVDHITSMTAVLRLRPHFVGEPIRTSWTGRPGSLRWVSELGYVDAAFENATTVRFRGQGIAMAFEAADGLLTPFTGPFLTADPVDGAAVFTLYETGRRYRITTLTGHTTVHGAGIVGESPRSVVVEPEDDGSWEVAVEQFETARVPYMSSGAFEKIVADVEVDFDSFVDGVAAWRTAETTAASLAAYVVWSATVGPAGFVRRESVLMSKHWMDSVWSWDHCFNALATVGIPPVAWDQLQVPFDHQDASGALPDSITHSRVLHNYVKPPIHGWMYQELLSAGLPAPQGADLAEWYDRLSAWTRFWLDHRRAPGHALPYYQHGNDSGWDNSTSFDASRLIETADLAAFLALQMFALGDIAADLGREIESLDWHEQGSSLVKETLAQLWNGDQFVVRDVTTGDAHASRSLLGVLPLVLGEHLPPRIRDRMAVIVEDHLTSHGPATEPTDSPEYDSDGYWRGPIWAPSTFVIERGLRRGGHSELADAVNERFRRLCEKSGFAENFDAVTGEGLRDRAYTWTASVYLVFARDHLQRQSLDASPAVQDDAI